MLSIVVFQSPKGDLQTNKFTHILQDAGDAQKKHIHFLRIVRTRFTLNHIMDALIFFFSACAKTRSLRNGKPLLAQRYFMAPTKRRATKQIKKKHGD